jgi:hypothetical protein
VPLRPYPSPYAEGHETATTCEADVLREFLLWWSAGVTSPVNLLEDDAELERQLWASVGCTGTRARLSNFLEAETIASTTAGLGEVCSDDGVDAPECGEELVCLSGRCEARPSEGETCDDGIGCRYAFDCVDRVCVRYRWFDEPCDGEHDPACDDGLACIDGRCDLPALHCKRGTLQRRVAPYEPPFLECISTGSPCRFNSDCGWGVCEGEGAWTCGAPGPHARPAPIDEESHDPPRCLSGGSCAQCNCPVGESCRLTRAPDGREEERCFHRLPRGVPCGEGECAPGLTCDFEVPAGGYCQPTLCRQTTFFPGPEE